MTFDLMQRLRSPENPRIVRRSIGRILTPRLASYYRFRSAFTERIGLELGGPSPFFRRRGLLPVYSLAARIDSCNFRDETIWEGHIRAQDGFRYDPRRASGKQFVAEASALGFLADNSYDFLLSSHMLEHSANPLRAVYEWQRVLKPGGVFFLVLPHKDGTFDHRRPVTPLAHMIEDFERGTGEDDLTHLPEILELHDLSLDPGITSLDGFKARSEKNLENRALHQHVFDTRTAVELVDHARFQIHAVELAHPYHIAVLATKALEGGMLDNRRFLGAQAEYRRSSPFQSDRAGGR
ncbi:MAG: methyltransferase domain-containing protein [Steroidobacteraceae bacterium]